DSVVIHRLNCNSDDFDDAFDEFFKHISYLAKENTKHFGSGRRNFGHSHK
ncbi:TPA: inovirus-type Gp2 protein, partial [Vibrio cholerae]